ncbi:hypothetical protein TNCT_642871, partial [Trichonephila clavata]
MTSPKDPKTFHNEMVPRPVETKCCSEQVLGHR